MNRNALRAALIAGLLATGAVAQDAPMLLLTPADIQWSETPALPPGARLAVLEGRLDQPGPITARLRLPANYRIPPHWHPVVERVTVLSGTFHYGMGEQFDAAATRPLAAGSLVVMPPGMRHYVWTRDATEVQLNVQGPWAIHYVNPEDDPRRPRQP